jgi:hypothetical protein
MNLQKPEIQSIALDEYGAGRFHADRESQFQCADRFRTDPPHRFRFWDTGNGEYALNDMGIVCDPAWSATDARRTNFVVNR